MRKFLLITFAFCLLSSFVTAQSFTVSFETGIGQYKMDELKKINDFVVSGLPFDTKIVSDFPVYWYYLPGIFIKGETYTAGATLGFQSTGSRVSGEDYSGEYRLDMKISSYLPGFYGEFYGRNPRKLKLAGYGSFGMSRGYMVMHEYFMVVDTTVIDQKNEYYSITYFFQPGIKLNYNLGSICFGLNMGYNLTFGGHAFYLDGNADNTLHDLKTNKTVSPDWSGFRLGLSVSYSLIRKHKE
jgi:hypothetical protein